MATNYFKHVWPGIVNRRYDLGGYMIALTEMTIEIGEELLHIPVGHHLTREQALNYPGDVQHVIRTGETSGTGYLSPRREARGAG